MRIAFLALALCLTASAQTYVFGGGKAAAIVGPQATTLPASCATEGLLLRLTADDGTNKRGLYYCVDGEYTRSGFTGTEGRLLRFGAANAVGETTGLSEDSNGNVTAPNLDYFGELFLRDWSSKLATITQSHTGTAVMAILGDSITANGYYAVPVSNYLKSRFGNSGAGYTSYSTHDSVVAYGTARSQTGVWTYTGKVAGVRGIDLSESNSTEVGATKVLSGSMNSIVIYYIAQVGGGTFTYTATGTGGVGPISVDTSSGTPGVTALTVSGLLPDAGTADAHTLTITVTDAGSAGVTLLGADLQLSTPGVRVHILGHSGMQASHLAGADATAWGASLASLAPNLVMIYLGANNMSAGATPASYSADLASIITRIHAVLPGTDIVLLGAADLSGTHAYTMSDYRAAERTLASAQSIGFIDLLGNMGSYADANARGMYGDGVHLNAAGGMFVANLVSSYLVRGTSSSEENLFGRLITMNPTASSQIVSQIKFPSAIVNDTVIFNAIDMSIPANGAYFQWSKPSNQGRTLTIRTTTSLGSGKDFIFGTTGLLTLPGNIDGFSTATGNTFIGNTAGFSDESMSILKSVPSGWTNPMFSIGANGFMRWGVSNAASDVGLGRLAAGILKVADGTTGFGTLVAEKIGIGTTSPSARLEVWGSIAGGWAAQTEGGCNTYTDLAVDGTLNTKVTSASYNFVAADVGSWLDITAGGAWTGGRYVIVSVAANAATLASSPAAVSSTTGTFVTGRGKIVFVEGATDDTIRICRKASSTFGWQAM